MNAPSYPIFLVYSEEDEAWLARVDQLGGCVVDGLTPEEALSNAHKAVAVWKEVSAELGRPIPQPLTLQGIEALQSQAAAKQQEMFQAAVQQVLDDVLRQFQSTKFHQVASVPTSSEVRIAGVGSDPSRYASAML